MLAIPPTVLWSEANVGCMGCARTHAAHREFFSVKQVPIGEATCFYSSNSDRVVLPFRINMNPPSIRIPHTRTHSTTIHPSSPYLHLTASKNTPTNCPYVFLSHASQVAPYASPPTLPLLCQNSSISRSQLLPGLEHPWKCTTKSPSAYVSTASWPAAGEYEFICFCGTSASFVRMVGCHWTMCSWQANVSLHIRRASHTVKREG